MKASDIRPLDIVNGVMIDEIRPGRSADMVHLIGTDLGTEKSHEHNGGTYYYLEADVIMPSLEVLLLAALNTRNSRGASAPPPAQSSDSIISEAQRKRLWTIANKREDILRQVLLKYRYDSTTKILVKDYDNICLEIENALISIKQQEEET